MSSPTISLNECKGPVVQSDGTSATESRLSIVIKSPYEQMRRGTKLLDVKIEVRYGSDLFEQIDLVGENFLDYSHLDIGSMHYQLKKPELKAAGIDLEPDKVYEIRACFVFQRTASGKFQGTFVSEFTLAKLKTPKSSNKRKADDNEKTSKSPSSIETGSAKAASSNCGGGGSKAKKAKEVHSDNTLKSSTLKRKKKSDGNSSNHTKSGRSSKEASNTSHDNSENDFDVTQVGPQLENRVEDINYYSERREDAETTENESTTIVVRDDDKCEEELQREQEEEEEEEQQQQQQQLILGSWPKPGTAQFKTTEKSQFLYFLVCLCDSPMNEHADEMVKVGYDSVAALKKATTADFKKMEVPEGHIRMILAALKELEEHEKPEDEKCCPITRRPFVDPVSTEDGRVYERSAIETWLQTNNTSPLTNEKLMNKTIISVSFAN